MWLIQAIFWIVFFLGLLDIYIAYRYIRSPEVDNTSGFLTWWMLKWSMATQADHVARKLGFPSQDLTEILKLRDDDGRIT